MKVKLVGYRNLCLTLLLSNFNVAMRVVKSKFKGIVIKSSPEVEQRTKDMEFLKLTPAQRLQIHEKLRKRIGEIFIIKPD